LSLVDDNSIGRSGTPVLNNMSDGKPN